MGKRKISEFRTPSILFFIITKMIDFRGQCGAYSQKVKEKAETQSIAKGLISQV